MNKKQFIKILKENDISFEEKKGKIVINGGDVYLDSLTTLPAGVEFNNGGSVNLGSLTTLSEGVEFNNGGNVYLNSLTTLPADVEFNNGGGVYLVSLTTLPAGVEFNNGGYVDLRSLTTLPAGVEFNNGGDVWLNSLTTLPADVEFNNGGYVWLNSLTTLPEGVQFYNGGDVYLKNDIKKINTPYIKRFNVETKGKKVYLYKRVSKDFKTQENTINETLWLVGTTVDLHKKWNPKKDECGEGKFHACAKPHWCSGFRSVKDDKFIKIEVNKKDIFEWKNQPNYPQKIAFKKAKVIQEI